MKRLAVPVIVLGITTMACAGRPSASGSRNEGASAAPARSDALPAGGSGSGPVLASIQDLQRAGWYARVTIIDAATRARMKYSWRRGCPVPIKNLRLIRMSFLGFDDLVHGGEMVVHRSVAADVVRVFHRLYDLGYPIRRMRLVDVYRGSDDRSMAADNTSAFNCRLVTGGRSWSQHSYGWAIDIDPVENPYVSRSGNVLPPAGRKFADRSRRARGMIHHGDAVWSAFRGVGWRWGGDWRWPKDYQHFSLTGR